MIETLTKEQEKRMHEIRNKRINLAFSGKKPDKEKIEKGINAIYKWAGYDNPFILYFDSPLGCQLACNYLNNLTGDQVRDQVGDQVRAQVRDQVLNQVLDQVGDQVRDQVRDQVLDQVGNQVRDQVGEQVREQVRDQVREQIGDQIRDQVRSQVGDQLGNQVKEQIGDQIRDQVREQVLDQVRDIDFYKFSTHGNYSCYGWVSFYDFFDGIIQFDKKTKENFHIYKQMLEGGVYDMIQLDNVCIVCTQPKKINTDDKGRLHGVQETAVQREDGYANYFIHGVSFDYDARKKFQEGKIQSKDILNRDNQDQKRAMLLECDYSQLLKEVNAKVVDTDTDNSGNEMNLYRVDLGDDEEDALFYEAVDNSKNEKVVLRVHPTEVKNCKEAKIWTWKILREKYKEGESIERIKET